MSYPGHSWGGGLTPLQRSSRWILQPQPTGQFQAVVMSILLYGCTTWTLTKWMEKKLDGNYTRILRAILNKSWRQHPTKHQLYSIKRIRLYLFTIFNVIFKILCWRRWGIVHHHHHYVMPLAWISCSSLATPSYRSSLLAVPQGYIPYPHRDAVCRFELVILLWFSCMRGSIGEHHMSSSLLLQQCPACLVRLTLIVFVMGGRWPYSWCFVGCCLQDLFKIARSILV